MTKTDAMTAVGDKPLLNFKLSNYHRDIAIEFGNALDGAVLPTSGIFDWFIFVVPRGSNIYLDFA